MADAKDQAKVKVHIHPNAEKYVAENGGPAADVAYTGVDKVAVKTKQGNWLTRLKTPQKVLLGIVAAIAIFFASFGLTKLIGEHQQSTPKVVTTNKQKAQSLKNKKKKSSKKEDESSSSSSSASSSSARTNNNEPASSQQPAESSKPSRPSSDPSNDYSIHS